jgi:hypothetical protein
LWAAIALTGINAALLHRRSSSDAAPAPPCVATVASLSAPALQPAGVASGTPAAPEAAQPAPPPGSTGPLRHWLLDFARLRPEESLLDYRDRVVPAALLLVSPQRERVARRWQEFVTRARLDDEQRQRADEILAAAGDELMSRIAEGVLSGELLPPALRPIRAVQFAGDLLALVEQADGRLRDTLRGDQREALRHSGFDVAEYLLFATRWEELVGWSTSR